MLTIRENLVETIKGGNPDRFVKCYEPFKLVANPGGLHNARPVEGGPEIIDAWGVVRSWPKGAIRAFPVHTPDKRVIKDVTKWKEVVKAPSVIWPEAEWERFQAQAEAIDRKEYYVTAMVAPGIFENCHHLGEIVTTLTNLYDEPEAMHDLIKYLTDYELRLAEQIIEHIHPDALFHHDDWGTQKSSFMSPAMFEEFYVPAYKEVYGYWHDHGVEVVVHHSDSYAENLVPDMIDIGIDIWQGCMTTNDLVGLIDKYGEKISFMGGIDNGKVDRPDWTRQMVNDEVRYACETYGAKKKYFIPCTVMGGPESLYEGVYEAVNEEIDKMSKEMF